MIKIGIHGASGKMGQKIISLLPFYTNCTLFYSYSRNFGILEELCENSDIIIDFSSNEAVDTLLDVASRHSAKLLIGTTGLTTATEIKIRNLSKKISILQTANTSYGITLLNLLAAKVSQAIPNYEVDIIDIHHAEKKDAPSGTALMLGKTIAEAKGDEFVAHNHLSGPRPPSAISFCAVRAGYTPGEHAITFTGISETIVLKHKTDDRKVFAEGAIQASLWLAKQEAGLYSMSDVLGI